MSYATAKAAFTTLIQTAIPGINVQDRNQQEALMPPVNTMPVILLRDRPHISRPLATWYEGRDWWLECMLWQSYQIDTDQADFDTMREQLEQVFRVHAWPNADDSTYHERIFVSGRKIESHDYQALVVNGRIYRHCLVSALVREAIAYTPV